MTERDAEKETCDFIGKIIGIDMGRSIFNPLYYHEDLSRLEYWLVANHTAFTISHMPKQDTDNLFMIMMGMEGYEDLIKVVHKSRAVAFVTAFCFLHGDRGMTRFYSDIEWFIQE